MANKRVRVGSRYVYRPVMLDVCDPPYNVKPGDIVRVQNLYGAPPANTMGHCHVVHDVSGAFAGLVCTNSLQPIRKGTK